MADFVIDASATLPWCFADEATPATNALLARLQTSDEALVPAHWPAEVANALLVAVRRGRISSQDAQQFLEDLDVLAIRIDSMTQKLVRQQILPPRGKTQPHDLRRGLSRTGPTADRTAGDTRW